MDHRRPRASPDRRVRRALVRDGRPRPAGDHRGRARADGDARVLHHLPRAVASARDRARREAVRDVPARVRPLARDVLVGRLGGERDEHQARAPVLGDARRGAPHGDRRAPPRLPRPHDRDDDGDRHHADALELRARGARLRAHRGALLLQVRARQDLPELPARVRRRARAPGRARGRRDDRGVHRRAGAGCGRDHPAARRLLSAHPRDLRPPRNPLDPR